jgi:ligand-binding sensor protein
LFCGEKCELQKDSKNPSRWRLAYKFRQILSPDRKTTLKESILETCAVRNDHSAEQVRLRNHGIVCDLIAAEARYHTDCRASFMSPDHLIFGASKSDKPEEDDHAMEYVIGVIKKDQSQIWNSIDLYELYIENEGKIQ